jgi:TnpA family transposase
VCAPREASYVLDGILENDTILKIREHTTDTGGFTVPLWAFASCLELSSCRG